MAKQIDEKMLDLSKTLNDLAKEFVEKRKEISLRMIGLKPRTGEESEALRESFDSIHYEPIRYEIMRRIDQKTPKNELVQGYGELSQDDFDELVKKLNKTRFRSLSEKKRIEQCLDQIEALTLAYLQRKSTINKPMLDLSRKRDELHAEYEEKANQLVNDFMRNEIYPGAMEDALLIAR